MPKECCGRAKKQKSCESATGLLGFVRHVVTRHVCRPWRGLKGNKPYRLGPVLVWTLGPRWGKAVAVLGTCVSRLRVPSGLAAGLVPCWVDQQPVCAGMLGPRFGLPLG